MMTDNRIALYITEQCIERVEVLKETKHKAYIEYEFGITSVVDKYRIFGDFASFEVADMAGAELATLRQSQVQEIEGFKQNQYKVFNDTLKELCEKE